MKINKLNYKICSCVLFSVILSACTTADIAKMYSVVVHSNANLDDDCDLIFSQFIVDINNRKGNLTDQEFRTLFGQFCKKCKNDHSLYWGGTQFESFKEHIRWLTDPHYYIPKSVITEWQQCLKYKEQLQITWDRNAELNNNIILALQKCKIYYDDDEIKMANAFYEGYKQNVAKHKQMLKERQEEAQRVLTGRVKTSDKKVSISGQAEYFEKSLDPINLSNQEGVVVNTMGEKVIVRIKVNGQDDLFVVNKNQIK